MERSKTLSLLTVCSLLTAACTPLPLSQSADQFFSALEQAPARIAIPLSTLQQLDPLLLRPSSLYPDFNDLPLPVLSALYHYQQRCTGSLQEVPRASRQLALALCHDTLLTADWFAAHPVSPLGGSNAWYYLQRHPEQRAALERMLHVRERPQALGGIGLLSDENLDALASGQRWLMQDGTLWRLHHQQWLRYAPQVWQPLARRAGITLLAAGGRCDIALSTLCIIPGNESSAGWRSLLAGAAIMASLSLIWFAWQRRRMQQRQRFILQMLTHELRTPIARLGNVVEDFRRDFDTLPLPAQSGFAALADCAQRMRQMAEASQHYLTGDSRRKVLEAPTALLLSDWLSHIAGGWPGLTFCLASDRRVALPLYWVTLCLNNLLDNAFRHGRAPVRLSAEWGKGRLTLRVTDAGSLQSARLPRLGRSLSAQSGMGLGLAIVRRIIWRLKGRLTLSGPPTTFTLELPCDMQ